LSHLECFAAAASLSGALDISAVVDPNHPGNDDTWLAEMRTVFGDLSKLPGSKHDLMALAKRVAKGSLQPRLYQCCGTEDELHPDNIRFRDVVRKLPLDLTYEEGSGNHNWAYWDQMIQRALAWMFPRGRKS
jgi:putative tributyrin esterase